MAKKEIRHSELVSESQNIDTPYELPEGWKWCRLGEVADWGSGGTPSRKNPEYYNGSIPWIKTGELNESYIFDSEEKISEEAINHSSAKLFPKETVVLAMYGATIGKTAIFGIDASTNQACACAICHKDLDNHYLFNFLKSKKDYFIYNAKGGAQPNISQEIIKNTFIPLPPTLAEQQRIVNRIESMFAKLDEAKEKAQSVVDSFETRKAAILHKAFTGELTANWRKANGVADESWEEKTIGELYAINPKTKADDDIAASFIPMEKIEANAVNRFSFEVKAWGSIKKNHTQFQDGDVCFAKISPCFENGKAFIAEGLENGIGAGTTELIILRNADVDTHFTFYLVTDLSFVRGGCATYSGTVGQQRINMDYVRNYKVSLPSLPEQQEIVRILDTVLEKEHTAKEAAEQVLEQIDLLKKSILARAFRGEL